MPAPRDLAALAAVAAEGRAAASARRTSSASARRRSSRAAPSLAPCPRSRCSPAPPRRRQRCRCRRRRRSIAPAPSGTPRSSASAAPWSGRKSSPRSERRGIRSCPGSRPAATCPPRPDLESARGRRGKGWALVRRAWLSAEDVAAESAAFDGERALPEAFERSVSQADGVADRLRHEADRVAQAARLRSDVARLAAAIGEAEAEGKAAEAGLAALAAGFAAAWAPAGIAPLSPAEMAEWLADHSALVRQGRGLGLAVGGARGPGDAALGEAGRARRRARGGRRGGGRGRPRRARQASRRASSRPQRKAARDREVAVRRAVDLRREIERKSGDRKERETRLLALRAEWREAVAPLGLSRRRRRRTRGHARPPEGASRDAEGGGGPRDAPREHRTRLRGARRARGGPRPGVRAGPRGAVHAGRGRRSQATA